MNYLSLLVLRALNGLLRFRVCGKPKHLVLLKVCGCFAVHAKGVRSRHVCSRVDSEGQRKTVSHPAPPGDQSQGLRI